MNTQVIKQAQKEFNELNKIVNYNDEVVFAVEVNIDHYSKEFDGSQSITEFVDMCIMIAEVQTQG